MVVRVADVDSTVAIHAMRAIELCRGGRPAITAPTALAMARDRGDDAGYPIDTSNYLSLPPPRGSM